jgi:hypothetical protein
MAGRTAGMYCHSSDVDRHEISGDTQSGVLNPVSTMAAQQQLCGMIPSLGQCRTPTRKPRIECCGKQSEPPAPLARHAEHGSLVELDEPEVLIRSRKIPHDGEWNGRRQAKRAGRLEVETIGTLAAVARISVRRESRKANDANR